MKILPKVINIDGIQQQPDQMTENSNIVEQDKWEDKIYEIDEQDYVHGGVGGFDNIPHEQLANRTTHLKAMCDNIIQDLNNFKTAVTNQNQKNDNDFSDIRNSVRQLQDDLTALTNQVNTKDSQTDALLKQLRTDVDKLISDMLTHTHKYAGSDTPGGEANTVKILIDNINKLYLTGSDSDALKKNDNVFMQNNEITANVFHGNLDGESNSTKRLTTPSMISFYGDVIASYLFDGSQKNLQVKASLATNGVIAGTYGPDANKVLVMSDEFIVPQVTVNNKGIVTAINNKVYTLPDEAVSGTTNATQDTGKMYLVGAHNQKQKEYTYSNNFAYEINGVLYSNDKEVINVSDVQSLTNKTYEGYTLKEGCSHGVDYSIQGTDGSKDLVTSNALFNHKHKYALSDAIDGSALNVKVSLNDVDKRYLVSNSGDSDKLEYNNNVFVQDNDLTSPVIHATDMMHIPGGRVWIDTSAQAVDGSSFNPATLAQIAQMQDDINEIKKAQSGSAITHVGNMASGVSCVSGNILYYSTGGYRLADNHAANTCTNIALAIEDSKTDGTVRVIEYGIYDTKNNTHDGDECYLDSNGTYVYAPITTSKLYSKKVGYMDGTYFVFTPSQYAVYIK